MFTQSYDWFLAHRGRPRRTPTALAPPAHRPLRRARRAEAADRVPAAGSLMASVEPRAGRSRTTWLAVALLALLAYVPALASSPGRMPADTKLYLYLEPGPADLRRPVDVRRPPVRRLGAPPGHRLPLAAGPVVLAGRHRRPARLGRPPAVDRHALFVAGTGVLWLCRRRFGLGRARRSRRGPRLPAVAVHPAVRVADVGDAAAVGRARLARRPHRRRGAAHAAGATPPSPPWSSSPSAPSTPPRSMMIIPGPLLWLIVRRAGAAGDVAASGGHGAAHRCALARRLALVDRRGEHPGEARRRRPRLLRVAGVRQLHVDVDRGVAPARLLADLHPRPLRRDDDGGRRLHDVEQGDRDRLPPHDRRRGGVGGHALAAAALRDRCWS